jgi:hypothetical protein
MRKAHISTDAFPPSRSYAERGLNAERKFEACRCDRVQAEAAMQKPRGSRGFFVMGPIGSALLLVGLFAAGGAFCAAFAGSLSGGGALGDLQCGFALGVQSGTAILWHVVVFVVCAWAYMASAVGARK